MYLFPFPVIQYGYVIFFVAVFPLAPFLAFISNIAEIRIDAQKFLMHNQRAVPKKVSGIGAWNGILQYATYLGIVTNVINFFGKVLGSITIIPTYRKYFRRLS